MLRRLICCTTSMSVLLAAACSPQFDWRTVRNDEGHYTVMLPAKPLLDERALSIAGQPMKMRMQSAAVGDAMFAVGVVTLPVEDPALRAQVLAYLQHGLSHNVGEEPVLRAVRATGSHGAHDESRMAMEVAGPVASGHGDSRRVIHAQFAARGRFVYQAAVVSERDPDPHQLEQFFGSLKLD